MSCPHCVAGSVHQGTPLGKEVKVGGIDAYVVGPEDSKRIIVIGVDIFGWKFVNTRLLADEYASKGFRVVIPDLFSGMLSSTTSIAHRARYALKLVPHPHMLTRAVLTKSAQ